jgi:tetratricopeptide (TPR) repeat protein
MPRLFALVLLLCLSAPAFAQVCHLLGEDDIPQAIPPLVQGCQEKLLLSLRQYESAPAGPQRDAASGAADETKRALVGLQKTAQYYEVRGELPKTTTAGINAFLDKNGSRIDAVIRKEPPAPKPDPAAAEKTLVEKVAKGETVKPEEYTGVGKSFLANGDATGAERLASQAIKAGGNDPDAYAIRSAARMSQGNNEGALADAQKALAQDPNNQMAREIAGYLHPAPNLGKIKLRRPDFGAMLGAESSFGAAGGSVQSRGPRTGEPSLVPARETRPANQSGRALTPSEALVQNAVSKTSIQDYSQALLLATKAIDADPKNGSAWTLRAEISKHLGNYPAAIKDAGEALKLDPRDAKALRTRSSAEFETRDFAKAYADADAAVTLEPGNALGYLYRAMAEEKLGDAKSAAADYQRAEALDSSLKPLCEEALKNLEPGHGGAIMPPATQSKKMIFRGGAIAASLVLLLLGFEGGRRAVTTFKRRKNRGEVLFETRPDRTIESGTVLGGNFRVVGELGRGGMGVVYEAFDLALQRRVAIKQLQRDEATTQEDFDRFLKEARLVAQLRHPNIAEIHSVIEDGGFYLVFEHIDGKTLESVIRKNGSLSLAETRNLLKGVCAALDYAHGRKIVHRDLKPSNIMVCPDGSAKIMDFGIAHQSQSTAGQTLTSASGTPAYMPPEQGFGSASPAADIYALAVMTYEMLTGSRPFTGTDLLGDKLAERFPAASQVKPSLPKGIDGLLTAALRADPAKRTAKGADFLRLLDQCALPLGSV